TCTRGGECADLAELHKRGGTHVAVDAACDHGVIMLINQAFNGGADGGHRRGASGFTNVVGPVEVEDVGNASGNAVREFAGHGVFCDFGKMLADSVMEFAKYVAPQILRESGEMLGTFQLSRALGEEDPERSEIVLLARHGIAE